MSLTQTAPVSPISTATGQAFEGNFTLTGKRAELIEIELFDHESGHTDEATRWTYRRPVAAETAQTGDYSIPLPASVKEARSYCWRVRVRDDSGTWTAFTSKAIVVLSSLEPVLTNVGPTDAASFETLNGVLFEATYEDDEDSAARLCYIQMRAHIPAPFEIVQEGEVTVVSASVLTWTMDPSPGNLLVLLGTNRETPTGPAWAISTPGWSIPINENAIFYTGPQDGGFFGGSVIGYAYMLAVKVSDGTETGVTVSAGGSATSGVYRLFEVSGSDNNLVAGDKTTYGEFVQALTTKPVTPPAGIETLIGGLFRHGDGGGPQNMTPGSGWTALYNNSPSQIMTLLEYKIEEASGSYAPNATSDSNNAWRSHAFYLQADAGSNPAGWGDANSWETGDLLWFAAKIVPRDGVISFPYGGDGPLAPGLYDWRMWVENERGDASNIIGGLLMLTVGWDADP